LSLLLCQKTAPTDIVPIMVPETTAAWYPVVLDTLAAATTLVFPQYAPYLKAIAGIYDVFFHSQFAQAMGSGTTDNIGFAIGEGEVIARGHSMQDDTDNIKMSLGGVVRLFRDIDSTPAGGDAVKITPYFVADTTAEFADVVSTITTTVSWILDVFFSACKEKRDYSLWVKGERVINITKKEWSLLPKYVIPKKFEMKEMRQELAIYKDQLFQSSLLPRLSKIHNKKYELHEQHFTQRHGDGKVRTRAKQVFAQVDPTDFEPVEDFKEIKEKKEMPAHSGSSDTAPLNATVLKAMEDYVPVTPLNRPPKILVDNSGEQKESKTRSNSTKR